MTCLRQVAVRFERQSFSPYIICWGSFLTPTYRHLLLAPVDTISEAIESVVSQTYGDIEYIVVDSASTDGTVDMIRRYECQIATLISERDKGIYDGLNKGLALATGDIVGFLHSDDLYENNKVIEKVALAFKQFRVDSVYGDLTAKLF